MKKGRRTKAQIEADKKKGGKVYPPRVLTFFYGRDGNMWRWWRNDNPGDMFDIISSTELYDRIMGADMCKIPVVPHLPGFCEDGINCPDHLGYR